MTHPLEGVPEERMQDAIEAVVNHILMHSCGPCEHRGTIPVYQYSETGAEIVDSEKASYCKLCKCSCARLAKDLVLSLPQTRGRALCRANKFPSYAELRQVTDSFIRADR